MMAVDLNAGKFCGRLTPYRTMVVGQVATQAQQYGVAHQRLIVNATRYISQQEITTMCPRRKKIALQISQRPTISCSASTLIIIWTRLWHSISIPAQSSWASRFQGYDAFNQACIPGFDPTNCPNPEGEDYDFGQAPMLFTVTKAGIRRDLVGAAQKSGIFWALDPDTGKVVWSRIFGPAGSLFAQWGSATDGQQIYVGNLNSEAQKYKLQPSGETTTGGSWSALDAATGKIIWQTAESSRCEG